jgi:hypothetical protein
MALYLVSSLVIPALHLAFAHHRHTLDPKTGQFLDVLVAGENGKGFSRTLVSSPENTIALLKIGRSLVYEHCPIANGLRLTSTPATGIPGYVRVFDERNSHPSIAAVSQPQSLILAIAPKRSPPRVTI